MRGNTLLTYGSLIGMVIMLTLQATSISTDPGFISWYYLHGGRAEIETEVLKGTYVINDSGVITEVDMTNIPLIISSVNKSVDPSIRAISFDEREEYIKELAITRYNQLKEAG